MPHKKFNGKLYNFYDAFGTKGGAKYVASVLRTGGWLVRIVFYDGAWALYRRRKEK